MVRRIVLSVVAIYTAIAAGCSSDGPPLAPVHGRVTLDDKPLAGKTLKFIPDAGTPGQGAGATTNAEGQYTLLASRPGATRDMPGAPPGAYRVVVTEPIFPGDLPVQSADEAEPVAAIGIPQPTRRKKQEIPAVYGNPDTTPLRVEVPEGGGAVNLALQSSPKK